MPKINVLPKHVAQLIAAGEVVERPLSVVKELMENSIDAGASSITVEIKNGGVKYIRIADNGSGIFREDVRTAFISHATSKIREKEDLDAIFTLGFRGEALPSIGRVARVYLLTRTAEEAEGTALTLEGGEEISLDAAGCPVGTTIIVRDLFYNTPARMKFLKKDVTEGNYVADTVTKVALSHPEIKFVFIRDEKRIFSTPGNGDLFACVHSLFGKEVSEGLIPCSYEHEGIAVDGFVSKPLYNRPTRNMQYFFVNGRYVKIPTGAAALDRAYQNTIMVGKFPMCFLGIRISADKTDVNVHPSKTEIRFSDENKLFEALFYAAKRAISDGDKARPAVALSGKSAVIEEEKGSQLSFSVKTGAVSGREPEVKEPDRIINADPVPSASGNAYKPNPKIDIIYSAPEEKDEPVQKPSDLPAGSSETHTLRDASGSVFDGVTPEIDFARKFREIKTPAPAEKQNEFENVRVLGQAFRTYIIAECGENLLIIDKHAAHERMIFNSLSRGAQGFHSQMLLRPVMVSLSGDEYSAVIENLAVFESAGYDIEDFGGSAVLVRACPVELTQENVASLIEEMAGKLRQGDLAPVPEKLTWLWHSTACRSAIKGGDEMTLTEMQRFVEELLSDDDVRYCPHGRPVLYELRRRELEKQFGRLG